MKKVGEIMREMGFNKESSEDTQKAFIKYLLRVANKNKHVPEPAPDLHSNEPDEWQEMKIHSRGHAHPDQKIKQPEQLAFDFVSKNKDEEAS